MDVRHFNRTPVAKQVVHTFEDVATGEAMFALDEGFDQMGEGDREFLLVPGVLCHSSDDGLRLSRA